MCTDRVTRTFKRNYKNRKWVHLCTYPQLHPSCLFPNVRWVFLHINNLFAVPFRSEETNVTTAVPDEPGVANYSKHKSPSPPHHTPISTLTQATPSFSYSCLISLSSSSSSILSSILTEASAHSRENDFLCPITSITETNFQLHWRSCRILRFSAFQCIIISWSL